MGHSPCNRDPISKHINSIKELKVHKSISSIKAHFYWKRQSSKNVPPEHHSSYSVGDIGELSVIKLDMGHVFKQVVYPQRRLPISRRYNSKKLGKLRFWIYAPFMSGHVLKTLPASRPATIAPLAILKPRR